MDRDEFIGFYKLLLQGYMYTPSNAGGAIISSYITDEGNDYQKTHNTEFLSILSMLPGYYKHCLRWAIDYYINKYSVVVITKEDPNSNSTQVITIY